MLLFSHFSFFGNIDFKAHNINFESRAVCVTYILPANVYLMLAYITVQANYSIFQALATGVSYANA